METQSINNQSLSVSQPSKTDLEARRVAEEFEAIFTSFIMRAMRQTVMKSDLIPESLGENIYTDMLDDEYAKIMAGNAKLGLADLIYKEIQKSEDPMSSLSALKGLNRQPWMMDNRFIPQGHSSDYSSLGSVTAYDNLIEKASEQFGVDASLIKAVITAESAGNPFAVSNAGAKGLMQLIDSTAVDMGVGNVFDPYENITGGTRYLKELLSLHSGDEKLALASYNAGPAAVKRYNGIPPYPETQKYVETVLKLRDTLAGNSKKEQNP